MDVALIPVAEMECLATEKYLLIQLLVEGERSMSFVKVPYSDIQRRTTVEPTILLFRQVLLFWPLGQPANTKLQRARQMFETIAFPHFLRERFL